MPAPETAPLPPLRITALVDLPQRTGMMRAALDQVRLLRKLEGVTVEVGGTPSAAYDVAYHLGIPSRRMRPWLRGRRVIGSWLCESSVAAADFRTTMDGHAQIWTPSEASAAALRALGSSTPVFVIPLVVPAPETVPERGGRDTVTTFMAFMSQVERKNPEAVLNAWQRAFPRRDRSETSRSARLVIKMRDVSENYAGLLRMMAGQDDRVEIINEDLDEAAMKALYERADIWCSLQRAGSFEYHVAEAAAHGLPVITTGAGGPLDYLGEDAAVFIPGSPIPPQVNCSFNKAGVWYEADVEAAAAALRLLAANADLRRQMGQAGRLGVQRLLNEEVVTDLMRQALRRLPPRAATGPPAVTVEPVLSLPGFLMPVRSGLTAVSYGKASIHPESPVILSHVRSGASLLGDLLSRHWGVRHWIKSHDWPEHRPAGAPGATPLYVLRNPVDTLHSTWRWWRSGASGCHGAAGMLQQITFPQWLRGDAGRLAGFSDLREADVNGLGIPRGQMYDPLRFWLDHWQAAAAAGIPVVLHEDLVRDPAAVAATISRAVGRRPESPPQVMPEPLGEEVVLGAGVCGADDEEARNLDHTPGKWLSAWTEEDLSRVRELLPQDLMRVIGRGSLEEWLGRA